MLSNDKVGTAKEKLDEFSNINQIKGAGKLFEDDIVRVF